MAYLSRGRCVTNCAERSEMFLYLSLLAYHFSLDTARLLFLCLRYCLCLSVAPCASTREESYPPWEKNHRFTSWHSVISLQQSLLGHQIHFMFIDFKYRAQERCRCWNTHMRVCCLWAVPDSGAGVFWILLRRWIHVLLEFDTTCC